MATLIDPLGPEACDKILRQVSKISPGDTVVVFGAKGAIDSVVSELEETFSYREAGPGMFEITRQSSPSAPVARSLSDHIRSIGQGQKLIVHGKENTIRGLAARLLGASAAVRKINEDSFEVSRGLAPAPRTKIKGTSLSQTIRAIPIGSRATVEGNEQSVRATAALVLGKGRYSVSRIAPNQFDVTHVKPAPGAAEQARAGTLLSNAGFIELVEATPEMPGDIPLALWERAKLGKEEFDAVVRAIARQVKANIIKRIGGM